jgi:hypothetical protein
MALCSFLVPGLTRNSYDPMVDSVFRLISPYPPGEVRERIARCATHAPPPENRLSGRPGPGIRASSAARNEIVLEQRALPLRRLMADRCRIELTPAEQGHGRQPPAAGTILICHFCAPPARRAPRTIFRLSGVLLAAAIAIGIVRDAGVAADLRGLFLFICFVSGFLTVTVGILRNSRSQPRARWNQQYVVSWLGQVVAARVLQS